LRWFPKPRLPEVRVLLGAPEKVPSIDKKIFIDGWFIFALRRLETSGFRVLRKLLVLFGGRLRGSLRAKTWI